MTDWSDDQKAAFCRQQFGAQRDWYRTQYHGASFQVVLVYGRPAGRLYVDRWDEEIRIVDIALLPQWRGRGVGSALLIELQSEAGNAGKVLSIHVERFNRALTLYRRLGFEIAGDHGVYLLLRWDPPSRRKAAVTDD